MTVEIHENAPPVVVETPAAVTVVEVEKEPTIQEAVSDALAIAAVAETLNPTTPELLSRIDSLERKLDLLLDKIDQVQDDVVDVEAVVQIAAVADIQQDAAIVDAVEEVKTELQETPIPPNSASAAPVAPEPETKKKARKRGFFSR